MDKLARFDYHGMAIKLQGKDMMSLTDTWKAAGSPENKEPWNWSRKEGMEFIDSVAKKLNLTENQVLKTTRGRYGGTFAHWQIWLAYAKYLSPELHMWANQVVKERIEEERNPELAYSRGRQRAIKGWKKQGRTDEWIVRRIKAIDSTKIDNDVLRKHGDDPRVFPMCANATNKEILGATAREYKAARGLPEKAITRDYLDEIQLLAISLANTVSAKHIENNRVYGNGNCARVHRAVAGKVALAIDTRGI